MPIFDTDKLGAPGRGLFRPREKRLIVRLLAGFVVVLGAAYFVQRMTGNAPDVASGNPALHRTETLETELAKPSIDVAALEAAALDERPEQRVVLPGGALEAGFAQSSRVYDGVYTALGGRELTPEIAAELVRAPRQHRGELLRVRCQVDGMRELPDPAGAGRPRRWVRGSLEGGAPVFLAVQEIEGAAPVPGDFVRADGLFVRVQREEVGGQWIEAPLLVGPRMCESYPRLVPVKELDAAALARVRDDSVAEGIEGLDHDTYWQLISYVRELEPGAVDWSKAAVLDNATIQQVFADGAPWRGKPVRVQVARMIDVWSEAQKENPLRADQLLEGWFANGAWSGQAKLCHFVAPLDSIPAGAGKGHEVVVRGFFYKNLAYTPLYGGAAIAPFLVVQSLEPYAAPEPAGLRHMTYMVAGSLVLIAIGMFFILRRDRRSSAELEAELRRRRRERRQKLLPSTKA